MIARIAELWAGATPPGRGDLQTRLKHPDEARLLRMVYGDAFWLLGAVCRPRHPTPAAGQAICQAGRHIARAARRYGSSSSAIRTTASANTDGMSTAAFEIADYFVDTSPPLRDYRVPDTELEESPVTGDLRRFLDLIRGDHRMLRPTDAEQAMYHAYAARLGSACLSRQVGAALIDRSGQLLATGCNEVPRAGGGLYGEGDGDGESREWGRCHRLNGFCSNTAERNAIIDDVLRLLTEAKIAVPEGGPERDHLRNRLRRSRLGQLIKIQPFRPRRNGCPGFSRTEGRVDRGRQALRHDLSCHNCARHIVAAGIDEVRFIEPYLKSRALALHADAITPTADAQALLPSVARAKGCPGTPQVVYRPYVGAAPRLYRRAFAKDGKVKDGTTGRFLPVRPSRD